MVLVRTLITALVAVPFMIGSAFAGEADAVAVDAQPNGDGTWRFDVSVQHADEGWDHYADQWEILAPDGTVLGVRVLTHPHVNEQPFTRSLSGVAIPANLDTVVVRARDSVHGYGGIELDVTIDR